MSAFFIKKRETLLSCWIHFSIHAYQGIPHRVLWTCKRTTACFRI